MGELKRSRAIMQAEINDFKKEQTSLGNVQKREKKERKQRMAGNQVEEKTS